MLIECLEPRRLFAAVAMGDANGDGVVDGADYSIIDNSFNIHANGNSWNDGDFNGDFVVDSSDYTLIDHAFHTQDAPTKTYAVRPGDSISDVLNMVNPGDTVVIEPGYYYGSLVLTRSGSPVAPITITGFDLNRTILQAFDLPNNFNSGSASYINISNLTFEGASTQLQTGGVTIGWHTNMSNCIVEDCQAGGLNIIGSYVTLNNVTTRYNGELGFKSAQQSNITVTNCVTCYNNIGLDSPIWAGQENTVQVNGLWYVSPQFEAGGGKFAFSNNVIFDGLESFGNVGHGFDFDINNTNSTIINSYFHDETTLLADYDAIGLSIEISYGPALVYNNVFANNVGGGLAIQVSQNVNIANNTFDHADLNLTNFVRGSNYALKNITIQNNTLVNSVITGAGNLYPWNTTTAQVLNLAIAVNIWQSIPTFAVIWGNTQYTLAAAQTALGIS